MEQSACYLGVDVGTGSARAALYDGRGRQLGGDTHPLTTWATEPDVAEQSTEDIWQACCAAVRGALGAASVAAHRVRGAGFDATCSLAVVDAQGGPVTVSTSGDDRRNVIVWMDHRAVADADAINRTGHEVLRYLGGRISPEMQVPKLRWLKTHLPASWARAAHFFDLADYLTFRATGSLDRSLCTTVCKWTYLGNGGGTTARTGWAEDFWRTIGLEDVADEEFRRIGQRVVPMGQPVGGLTPQAAGALGLLPGTPVGAGIIDAHAGGLGVLSTRLGEHDPAQEGAAPGRVSHERRLALIGGTSSCHMAVAAEARFIDGIWGPYASAMVPGLWLNEGGQTATGALVDHVVSSHSRASELAEQAESEGATVYALLNRTLDRLAGEQGLSNPALLTRGRHVLPYFHGNRSPRADPSLRGVMTGLALSNDVEELALRYLATVQAIAYGTRHIVETLNASGYRIDTLTATGGGTKNPVFLQAHADATGCRVVVPQATDAVLLGSAMLGAVAAGDQPSVEAAMLAMSQPGDVVAPYERLSAFHAAKYAVFLRLYEDARAYRRLMETAATL